MFVSTRGILWYHFHWYRGTVRDRNYPLYIRKHFFCLSGENTFFPLLYIFSEVDHLINCAAISNESVFTFDISAPLYFFFAISSPILTKNSSKCSSRREASYDTIFIDIGAPYETEIIHYTSENTFLPIWGNTFFPLSQPFLHRF